MENKKETKICLKHPRLILEEDAVCPLCEEEKKREPKNPAKIVNIP